MVLSSIGIHEPTVVCKVFVQMAKLLEFSNNLYIIIAGATPLVTISASESNCFPNSPETFKSLAKKPSKKSNKIPSRIKNAAKVTSPFKAKIVATNPENKFAKVIKFGICFLIVVRFIIVG